MDMLTRIELSPQDAQTFIKFQKHYALINLLESIGAFDITNGSVEIHFDTQGVITKVRKQEYYVPNY